MILRSNLVELCNFTLDLDEILNLIESVSEFLRIFLPTFVGT